MKYYVTADIHGFYTPLQNALKKAGYFEDPSPKKLVVLGDLMDRGKEALRLQAFILGLLEKDGVILIRGNHEDLMESFLLEDQGLMYSLHLHNGTYDTALQLTGLSLSQALRQPSELVRAMKETPFFQTIMPAMADYFEVGRYVFTHGWIPCIPERDGSFSYYGSWRDADATEWRKARWYNGMAASQTVTEDDRTILCGHWHASFGHSKYEGKGSEFGPDADFTPYYGPGVIALDACTAKSGFVNCIVLEAEEKTPERDCHSGKNLI